MIDYKGLNHYVNEIFFSGKYAAAPVYLSLEGAERDRLANEIGAPADELDSCIGRIVASSLDFEVANVYREHQDELRTWQRREMDTPPPQSALLLTLTLAAEHMRKEGAYSASNYYERLCEVLGINDDRQKPRIRAAGKYTRQFWHALNLWLTGYDYALGKPTAQQVNSWAYVSYAISQALVRQGDRVRFHSLFADFGLSPNDKLSESEMMLYLHEWMAGSGPSQWLRRLWESPDIRERVASAALDTLEQWDSRSGEIKDGPRGYRRLAWFAVLRTFPHLRCRLHLVAGASDSDTGTTLKLTAGATGLAREALSAADSIWLEEMPDTGQRILGPEDKIKLGALLLTSLELESKGEGDLYRHDSRPVIPFIKDETGRYYREVSRVTLHMKHLVLCHTNWAGQIEAHLEKFAQAGFSKVDGTSSNGIPPEWTLFREVTVSAAPTSDVSDNLQCLVPISSGATISMSGGLKLAQNIWHASAPPKVIASDESGFIETKLQSDIMGVTSETIASTQPESYDPDFISKSGQMLDAKNLTVSGLRGGKKVVERSLAFRTANTPRRKASLESNYAYSLDKSQPGLRGFSAIVYDYIHKGSPAIRGMLTQGEFDNIAQGLAVPTGHELPGQSTDAEVESGFNMAAVAGGEATCILRGHHHFICDPYLWPGTAVSRTMQCKDCHIFQIAPKASKGRHNRHGGRSNARQIAQSRDRFQTSEDREVSPNAVFDALCYLGSGTWASVVPILASIVEEPWRVSIVREELVDLGMIDIALDSEFGRPRYWSCPPPALVVSGSGTAYLAGFRNATLVRDVKARMDDLANSYRLVKNELAPIGHTWNVQGREFELIEEQLKGAKGPLNRPIAVVESPGALIANQMPFVDEILDRLKPLQLEDGDDIERFDPRTCKWERSKFTGVGAYRALFHGRRYLYRTEDGRSLETSVEVVKVLAARHEGVRLHSYNPATQVFDCAIGCKPPGLFRRALVSQTGALPITSGPRHSYRHVPPTLAALVLNKLYR